MRPARPLSPDFFAGTRVSCAKLRDSARIVSTYSHLIAGFRLAKVTLVSTDNASCHRVLAITTCSIFPSPAFSVTPGEEWKQILGRQGV